MLRTLTAASMLTLACAMPLQEAAAQDPIAGGILGGVAGGLLGGAIGGRGGAIAGAIIGGTTGAAIAAQGQRRANGYYWYNNGCYAQRPDGAWTPIPPEYCGAPVVAAPPPGYGARRRAMDRLRLLPPWMMTTRSSTSSRPAPGPRVRTRSKPARSASAPTIAAP